MLIGYARVSTDDQSLDLQRDALLEAGCEKIFDDQMSGAKSQRPGLSRALDQLRADDVLVVWRLDRLGRSLKDLIAIVEQLHDHDVGLRSLTETIDTTSSAGKLYFHLFGALAEFERTLIRERTNAGLAAARARGRQGGRPKILNAKKRQHAIDLYEQRQHSVAEICTLMGISKQTLYNYLDEKNGSKSQKDGEKTAR